MFLLAFLLVSALIMYSCSERPAAWRDLNKNGKLDVYEDHRSSVEERVTDLLAQMTLEEKAGLMFINGTFINPDGSLDRSGEASGFGAMMPSAITLIRDLKMNHFNLWEVPSALALAEGYNAMQREAENSRLGIPVTLASDPRNHFSSTIFAMEAIDFSQWCEPLGFGAIGDEELVRRFADIARQEYLAVGMRMALHPQVDLATEPRWPRISGSFSEDAQLTARLARAYILGFQGESLGSGSVACMTKHFPGGGPQKEGLDPHFEFQKGQVYPGNAFDYHIIPFEAAFDANTAAIMPYYGIPTGQTSEEVAMAFNRDIITGLLREKYGYDGVVCTDWGTISDTRLGDYLWPARAWGAEELSEEARVKKMIDAGVDQFGGESRPELVIALVRSGQIPEERIDISVRRLLRLKFQLGLFDNPYIDVERVLEVLGNPEFRAAGEASQRRAFTLLKNEAATLPLSGKPKIYLRNVSDSVAARYGTVVSKPEDADFAIVRLQTPWYPVDTPNRFAAMFHHGDLDFQGPDKDELLLLLKTVPTIVDIYLDRPAVIPEISQHALALLANFGASDAALLDVVFGLSKPEGRLPFELPSSMDAVRLQKEDLPYDSKDPLYPFGFGLFYP